MDMSIYLTSFNLDTFKRVIFKKNDLLDFLDELGNSIFNYYTLGMTLLKRGGIVRLHL